MPSRRLLALTARIFPSHANLHDALAHRPHPLVARDFPAMVGLATQGSAVSARPAPPAPRCVCNAAFGIPGASHAHRRRALRSARDKGPQQWAWSPAGTPGGASGGHAPVRDMRCYAIKSKQQPKYACSNCGRRYFQHQGQCDECEQWGTVEEALPEESEGRGGGGAGNRAAMRVRMSTATAALSLDEDEDGASAGAGGRAGNGRAWLQGTGRVLSLSAVSATARPARRLSLPGAVGAEVGRVLGGGVVPGACVLIGGDPGVGKSTLLMQVADLVAGVPGDEAAEVLRCRPDSPVLYVSGEESAEQITARAERMGVTRASSIALLCETDMDVVLSAMASLRPRCVIVDSIQTMYLEEAGAFAGSTTQIRECARAANRVAKETGAPVFLVGHVTKAGEIAGPKVLEHMVDAVVYVEGERNGQHRVLRTIKNRFGSTDEVALFDMAPEGLRAVPNPSEALLRNRKAGLAEGKGIGSVVAVACGGRPMLVEIQALATPVLDAGQPSHTYVTGLDARRLYLILQVLQKHARVKAFGRDVTVNVVGGYDFRGDPSSDLPLAVAVTSSLYDRPVGHEVACVGGVGLAGEIRAVPALARRIAEADRMGLRRIIVPKAGFSEEAARGVRGQVIPVSNIRQALQAALGGGEGGGGGGGVRGDREGVLGWVGRERWVSDLNTACAFK